jgi:hypothetical protein
MSKSRLAALAALCAFAGEAHALAPSAAGAPATLVVTYELVGSGVDRPPSGEKNVTWTFNNRFVVTTKMKAVKAQGVPSLHQIDAKKQAELDGAQSAAAKAAKDAEPMMAQAERIFEKCGDDEACIERETMKMAGSMDMDAAMKAGQSTAKAGEAATRAAANDGRYQSFGDGAQSGTYSIDETAHEAYFDAACSPKNEATCSIDTTVKGSGAMTAPGGKATTTPTAVIEVDYAAGTAILMLTMPGVGKATETVKSGSPDRASGVSTVERWSLPPGMGKTTLQGKCAAGCATATGEYVTEVDSPLLRKPTKYKISWKFTRP